MKHGKSAAAVFGLLVTAVALSSLPSARYFPAGLTRAVKAVAVSSPQGWAFFTKDPTEAADLAYLKRGGRWVPVVDALPTADAMGLSRRARAIDAEVAALSQAAGDASSSCAANADVQRCALAAPRVQHQFELAAPPVCEPVLIRKREPIPFAYGTRVSAMPSKVVIVDAQCPA
ncbi:hypothetical protein [Curtobacterium sp. MCJR17_043]|uniref:hypothetical protein n=1 Tax=unclassified Curtobacterium TaxID=257496 RepID=UPI0015E8E91A